MATENGKITSNLNSDNSQTNIYTFTIAQLVSAPDLATSSVQVEGSILTAVKRLSLKNLNVIIRTIN